MHEEALHKTSNVQCLDHKAQFQISFCICNVLDNRDWHWQIGLCYYKCYKNCYYKCYLKSLKKPYFSLEDMQFTNFHQWWKRLPALINSLFVTDTGLHCETWWYLSWAQCAQSYLFSSCSSFSFWFLHC